MAKLAALMVVTLLGLLGSVACQPGSTTYYPIASQTASRPASPSGLTLGYYKRCPEAEYIVKTAVEEAIGKDPSIGPGLVRLFFHDCFVRGCDASVLLKNTSGSTRETEMFGLPNKDSLRGMEVIEAAKTKLEKACPRNVSCADIVSFAARDAARNLSGGAIDIKMPAGRLDGRVSIKEEAEQNLPSPFGDLKDLTSSFVLHGLDFNDMITLSGAHSFGKARCKFFGNRLTSNPPSNMDSGLRSNLSANCSKDPELKVVQDPVTPDALDNQYYKNVHSGKVLFTSDDALNSTAASREVVDGFARNGTLWNIAFANAMVKMGEIKDKTAGRPDPEIRVTCSMYNTN